MKKTQILMLFCGCGILSLKVEDVPESGWPVELGLNYESEVGVDAKRILAQDNIYVARLEFNDRDGYLKWKGEAPAKTGGSDLNKIEIESVIELAGMSLEEWKIEEVKEGCVLASQKIRWVACEKEEGLVVFWVFYD